MSQYGDNALDDAIVSVDVDAEAAATLFVGMIQGLVIHATVRGYKEALEDESKRVFRIYLSGIAATGSARG